MLRSRADFPLWSALQPAPWSSRRRPRLQPRRDCERDREAGAGVIFALSIIMFGCRVRPKGLFCFCQNRYVAPKKCQLFGQYSLFGRHWPFSGLLLRAETELDKLLRKNFGRQSPEPNFSRTFFRRKEFLEKHKINLTLLRGLVEGLGFRFGGFIVLHRFILVVVNEDDLVQWRRSLGFLGVLLRRFFSLKFDDSK